MIVKGASIVFVGFIISKFFSYLYRLFIARYFGPTDYGLFSLGLAVLGLFTTIALLGLSSAVIRYTAYYKAKNDERRVKGTITSSLKMALPFSILLSILLIILSPYLAVNLFQEQELMGVLIILSFSIPFSTLFYIFVSVFVGFKRIKYQVYSENIFSNLAKLIFITIFGILGFGVLGITWAFTLSVFLSFLVSIYFLGKVYPILKTKVVSIPLRGELLRYSLPLTFMFFMGFIILWTDTIMLGYFKSASDVGIYNAAVPTAQLLLLFPNALTCLFLPIITGLHARGKKKELESIYKTITRWIFYINFPVFLLMILFSRQILNLLFGPVYISGYMSLVILSFGFLLHKNILAIRILEMLKKTRHLMYITIICSVTNVTLNYLLIPIYGITGAAVATVATQIVMYCLLLLFSYHFTKMIPFSMNMIKSVISGIVAIAITHSVARLLFSTFSVYTMAVLFFIFISLYIFTILLLRSFKREDIEIMKAIERKSGIRIAFLRKTIKRFV